MNLARLKPLPATANIHLQHGKLIIPILALSWLIDFAAASLAVPRQPHRKSARIFHHHILAEKPTRVPQGENDRPWDKRKHKEAHGDRISFRSFRISLTAVTRRLKEQTLPNRSHKQTNLPEELAPQNLHSHRNAFMGFFHWSNWIVFFLTVRDTSLSDRQMSFI